MPRAKTPQNVEDLKEVCLETPYGRSITLRRSFLTKNGWEYLCHRFGLLSKFEAEKVVSIKIEGRGDFDRLAITAVVERDKPQDDGYFFDEPD